MPSIDKEIVLQRLDPRAFYRGEIPSLIDISNGRAQGLCPFHEDSKPSFTVFPDGKFKCFGCGERGDVFSFYQKKHGCGFKDALSGLAQVAGVPSNGKARGNGKGRIVRTYDYVDESGKLIYQTCRMEPKDFRQCRPDGAGGWVWNLTGVKLVPYRLPEVLKSECVFIVEGEEDADNLAALGLTATTNPMGALKWRDELMPHFKGKRVCIVPDNDPPDEKRKHPQGVGRSHARDIARHLYGVATSVKVVDLPRLPPKGDTSDWLASGGTKEQLLALVESAPTWAPGMGNEGTKTSQQTERSKPARQTP